MRSTLPAALLAAAVMLSGCGDSAQDSGLPQSTVTDAAGGPSQPQASGPGPGAGMGPGAGAPEWDTLGAPLEWDSGNWTGGLVQRLELRWEKGEANTCRLRTAVRYALESGVNTLTVYRVVTDQGRVIPGGTTEGRPLPQAHAGPVDTRPVVNPLVDEALRRAGFTNASGFEEEVDLRTDGTVGATFNHTLVALRLLPGDSPGVVRSLTCDKPVRARLWQGAHFVAFRSDSMAGTGASVVFPGGGHELEVTAELPGTGFAGIALASSAGTLEVESPAGTAAWTYRPGSDAPMAIERSGGPGAWTVRWTGAYESAHFGFLAGMDRVPAWQDPASLSPS